MILKLPCLTIYIFPCRIIISITLEINKRLLKNKIFFNYKRFGTKINGYNKPSNYILFLYNKFGRKKNVDDK